MLFLSVSSAWAADALAATASGSDTTFAAAVGLAFLGGLILNLMPCVLPMLSIKAIGLLENNDSRGRARKHAIFYTTGVLSSFATIGLVIVSLRSAGHAFGWGAQLQQPLFVGLLVCVMVAVGLSMSGVVQFGTSFGRYGQGLTEKRGWAGEFFTGVLAVAVASPCIAPFMGTALAYAFAAPLIGALLVFLALGLGLAAPFLLIGFVPSIGRILPRPGAWMETLKQLLAFPMYFTAVWLVWVLAHQRGADAVGLVLIAAVLLGLTLWWFERTRHREVWKRAFTILFGLGVIAPLYKLTQLQVPAPAVAAAEASEQSTMPYTPEKLAELRKQGRPVFVDMTADWCITCKANEKHIMDTAEFKELLKTTNAVYMIGDWTDVNATIQAYLDQFHSPGVPLYVVYPKGGGEGKQLPTVLTFALVRDALVDAAK
jgi:thiol:disulfide interchange protein DsbD